MHSIALPARKILYLLLLIATVEIEFAHIGTAVKLLITHIDDFITTIVPCMGIPFCILVCCF